VTDTTTDPRTARTERIVLVIGLLVTYGATVFWSLVMSILMVGGGGEATGIYLAAAALLGATVACFVVSLRLAARRRHVRAILLGLVPIPLVVGIFYGAVALISAFRN
jgi:hypothetical protein